MHDVNLSDQLETTKINKLTVIIPAYNEEATIRTILDKVNEVKLIQNIGMEIIVVNDCSQDDTEEMVLEYQKENPQFELQYIKHDKNQGKGAALHTGIQAATGDYLIVQDADLEYDPHQFNILLQPVIDGFADVVYGSRFKGGYPHRILFFWHTLGNNLLTFLSNVMTNLNLSDMETCYKLFHAETIKSLNLKEKRFGFEPEVTAKISRVKNIRIYEVGISYYGRTYAEGKKINWKDGFRALWCILKYNLWSKK